MLSPCLTFPSPNIGLQYFNRSGRDLLKYPPPPTHTFTPPLGNQSEHMVHLFTWKHLSIAHKVVGSPLFLKENPTKVTEKNVKPAKVIINKNCENEPIKIRQSSTIVGKEIVKDIQ